MIEQAIQYRDTYEKRGDEWLFVKRNHVLWYGVETASATTDSDARSMRCGLRLYFVTIGMLLKM